MALFFYEICRMSKRILLHVGFWVVYALYDGYLSAPLTGTSFEGLSFVQRLSLGYQAALILLGVKIPAVYFVLYYLIPRFLPKNKHIALALSILGVAVAVTLINHAVWRQVLYPYLFRVSASPPAPTFAIALFRWLWSSFDILMLLGIASSLKFFRMRLQNMEREKQLIAEKLQSELQFLRAQTNPHFLFNTLNNIYGLARKQSPQAAEIVMRLSQLLRFMLYECSSPRIALVDEIKVISDYIELEKLRYNQRLQVNFGEDIDDPATMIAPLLLLPFVENAFKHGAGESRFETRIDIRLQLRERRLEFEVRNNKDPEESPAGEGIGLKNVRRQLELIYPDKHALQVEAQANMFRVFLVINLD